MLTQERIVSQITFDHLIGLRFASDEEFVSLVEKTLEEDVLREEIKHSVNTWRAYHYRI